MIGGVLATAGNLVFAGEGNGWFKAYDAKTGKVLWQYQCGAGVNAPATSYTINGKQYIAIASGLGRSARNKLTRTTELRTASQATMIWVFGL